jgi:hypothetical protein
MGTHTLPAPFLPGVQPELVGTAASLGFHARRLLAMIHSVNDLRLWRSGEGKETVRRQFPISPF